MNGREFWALRDVSDEKLEASLSRLLGAGARLEARVVAHLAEVDARRLHLALGCSSLYDYCRKRLGLSDYEAFARIAAARVARKYPVVFEMLESRQLHLTAVCEVREFLTTENHRDLLIEISGKTKLQIREILARHFPRADLPSSLKKVPSLEPLSPGRYRLQVMLSTQQKEKLELARDLMTHANPSGELSIVLERALDQLISRLEKRRFGRTTQPAAKLRSQRTNTAHERAESTTKMLECRETARNETARGDTTRDETAREEITRTNAGLSALSASNDLGAPSGLSPPSDPSPPSDLSAPSDLGAPSEPTEPQPHADRARRRTHIAQETRRQLLERDGCSCAFVGSDGQRCAAREFLQFHHRRAWARGGPDSADNLQVLCRAHNRLLAEQDFGRAKIERAIVEGARVDQRRGG